MSLAAWTPPMPMKRGHHGSQHVAQVAMSFEPARLTIARELRGFTRSELDTKLELPGPELARLEGAHAGASAKTLARLALALGIPIHFFARHGTGLPIPLESCHFRHLRPASQIARRRVLALA